MTTAAGLAAMSSAATWLNNLELRSPTRMHDAPADDFQRSLVNYTAPPDWPTPRYKLVVLGAGPAG